MKLRKIIENEYAGLEDNDEFEEAEEEFCSNCMGGAGEIERTDDTFSTCDTCSSRWCSACLPGGGIYNRSLERDQIHHAYESRNGQIGPRVTQRYNNEVQFKPFDFKIGQYGGEETIIACPSCWDVLYNPPPDQDIGGHDTVAESSDYDGLEDNDEFDDQNHLCYECGDATFVEVDGDDIIECSDEVCDSGGHFSCIVQTREDKDKYSQEDWSFLSTGWYFSRIKEDRWGDSVRTNDDKRHRDFVLCPECIARGDYRAMIKESSEYAGLEDDDKFDDGSDREEAEEIQAYFKTNNIIVVERNGVVNIVDKHGVLEGLPDGRRFGDDLPVDRVVTPGRDPNFTNDLFVIWINEMYGLTWLVNYGNDWNIIDQALWQEMQRWLKSSNTLQPDSHVLYQRYY